MACKKASSIIPEVLFSVQSGVILEWRLIKQRLTISGCIRVWLFRGRHGSRHSPHHHPVPTTLPSAPTPTTSISAINLPLWQRYNDPNHHPVPKVIPTLTPAQRIVTCEFANHKSNDATQPSYWLSFIAHSVYGTKMKNSEQSTGRVPHSAELTVKQSDWRYHTFACHFSPQHHGFPHSDFHICLCRKLLGPEGSPSPMTLVSINSFTVKSTDLSTANLVH